MPISTKLKRLNKMGEQKYYLSLEKRMNEYNGPFWWQDLTPLWHDEPIAVFRKERVWFVDRASQEGLAVTYQDRIIPLQLYFNQLLMLGKVTEC